MNDTELRRLVCLAISAIRAGNQVEALKAMLQLDSALIRRIVIAELVLYAKPENYCPAPPQNPGTPLEKNPEFDEFQPAQDRKN